MSDYMSKNESLMIAGKYIVFAIVEFFIVMQGIENRPGMLYKIFGAMALFQAVIFYFSYLKSYQPAMLNMYLSYGYNRMDILKVTFKKMAAFITTYTLLTLAILIASIDFKDALLLLTYKVVVYLMMIPLVSYSLLFNKKEYPWIFTAIIIVAGLFVPVILAAGVIGIMFTLQIKKDLYKRNLI